MDELKEMQQRASSEANGASLSLSLEWVARSEPPTELRASRQGGAHSQTQTKHTHTHTHTHTRTHSLTHASNTIALLSTDLD